MSTPQQVGRTAAATLMGRPDAALKLPPASDGAWLRADIGIEQSALSAFHQAGAIEAVGSDGNRNRWQTKQGVAEWVEDKIAGRTTTPCGCSTGIRTIEPGTYTCRNDDCDETFGRETAEEVVA
jgi:hypothetical protein